MVFKSIGRGFKKVFRGVKKVIKKVAKPALIIGAVLMTAGLVTGGFAAFTAASGPLGFLKAAGQTMLAGGQSIAGSLGIGGGLSGSLVAEGGAFAGMEGATLGSGVLAQSLGFSSGPTADALTRGAEKLGPGPFSTETLKEAGATKGVFSKLGSAFAGLGDLGQYAIIQGTLGGISSVMQGKAMRRQERREDAVGGFGTPSRGEGGYTPEQIAQIFSGFELKTPASGTPPSPPEVEIKPKPTPPERGEELFKRTAQRGLLDQEEYQPQRFESSWATRSNLPRDEMGIPRPLLG